MSARCSTLFVSAFNRVTIAGGVPAGASPNNTYGAGRINAKSAVDSGANVVNQPPTVAITAPAADGQQFNCRTAVSFSAALRPMMSVGPAGAGGRVVDIAVAGEAPRVIYAATGSGGIWKSPNEGTTWEPIFDRFGVDLVVNGHNHCYERTHPMLQPGPMRLGDRKSVV